MINSFTKDHLKESIQILNQLDPKCIDNIVNDLVEIRSNKGRVFFLGVGGSAANASHAVNDFRKITNIECYAPTDNVSELTARTNDEGFETIFSEYLRVSRLSSNDAILIFSVGGGSIEKNVSLNLISAIETAKSNNTQVFSLVGKADGYAAKNSDISIVIPVKDTTLVTPMSEAFQAVIWHCIVSHPSLAVNATKW